MIDVPADVWDGVFLNVFTIGVWADVVIDELTAVMVDIGVGMLAGVSVNMLPAVVVMTDLKFTMPASLE